MEEKVQISVRGRYSPQYAIVVDHEGYTPVTAAQVQIRDRFYLKDIKYAINKKVDRCAIDFAIRRLKQPFFVIPSENDLVSNSGNHSVVFSDSFLSARGLYVLEKELTFPRPRPRVCDLMEKLKSDFRREYIAWVVGRDQVYKLWVLKYAGSPDAIELTIPEDFELERLQGNLYYTPLEIDEETKYSLPWRTKFRMFNHEFEDIRAVSFVYNNSVYAIVRNARNTCIHSEDHESVTLRRGTYLLYHPFPSHGQRD